MRTPTLLPLAGAAALALAFVPRADKVAFRPADGKELARSYQIELEASIGDFSLIVDGQDMSEAGEIPSFSARFVLDATDHFVKSTENRHLELIRDYDGLEVEFSADGDSNSPDGLDKLEGKSVRFVWNEEESDYDASFHESSGDEELLKALGADMDMIFLLPGREVSPGDKWTVDAKHIFPLLLFGATTQQMDGGGDAVGEMIAQALSEQMEELAKGFSLTCEYKGRRDAGGVDVAAIALKLVGEGRLELARIIEDLASENIPPEAGVDLAIDKAEMNIKIDGEGELLWSLAGGHMQAYDLLSKMATEFVVELSANAMGESHEVSAAIELDTTGTWKVRPR